MTKESASLSTTQVPLVCAPARASLLTGRYSHRTGSLETREVLDLGRLGPHEVTLADEFKAAGYDTGMVGKWHLGTFGVRYHPNARGFDHYIGFRGGGEDYYAWRLDCNGAPVESDGRYLTDVFTESAGIVDVAVKGVDAKRHQDQGNSPKCDASRGALILTEWRRHAEDRFLA